MHKSKQTLIDLQTLFHMDHQTQNSENMIWWPTNLCTLPEIINDKNV